MASRKLLLTLLVLAIGSAASWFGKLSPELVNFLTLVLGAYCTANVGQKAAELFAQKVAETPQ